MIFPTTQNSYAAESRAGAQLSRFVQQPASPFLYSAILLSLAAVLVADLMTPLGVAVWVIYLIPVSLSLWLWRPWMPLLMASLCTILMIATFLTDAPGVDRTVAQLNRGFGIITVWGIAFVGYFFIGNRLAVRKQTWLQLGQTKLSAAMAGDQSLEQLGESILRFLTNYLDAPVAAIFARNGGNFTRIATFGVPRASDVPESFVVGDGLLGQVAKDGNIVYVDEVPDGYLTLGSALGRGKPRFLLIAPIRSDGVVTGAIELGFSQPVDDWVTALFERTTESISSAILSANYRRHLQSLLEETQRQAEELQAQSEELRVTNEELEEQSRALRESQTRLENQQAELEQTNSQLEEQAQLLENQRDDLARANLLIQDKTRGLEQATQYKSDFLANVSHELRTPLNSSLILAKLLADNQSGNLTEEQVKFATTIMDSGNDLLNLINDILDLSKIEAGRMEIRAEHVQVSQLIDDLTRVMNPIAMQKKLTFRTSISPNSPNSFVTDRQRLEQVLKNLLSNAFKFTERGEVRLTVSRLDDRIAFAVSDTGIGIPQEQQQVIFEAFRQADGTTHRKYGGTGLGLSISRELSHLLGGEISLESESGAGSTFTVSLPLSYDPTTARTVPRRKSDLLPTAPAVVNSLPSEETPAPRATAPSTEFLSDDRSRLTGDSRVILIVEDDLPFAQILLNLAHELRFHCLIASTAEDAMMLATQYCPSGVLLDVGLPDHSGLTVLDRLKQNPRTRHIPVHVVSANDYTQTAMSLGAVGFMLKPVSRDSLAEALQGLETRFSKRMRQVLVVEDDPVQLSSMRSLLNSHDVSTVGVGSAADCLEQLKTSTFDCMVVDLSLPDASGFSLLETLSREDTYSFPPAIVYTGRDLSLDEEQRLRRYSKSIIIKGAKSPERLLDEVTLFLHQVVAELPPEQQRMIEKARSRDAAMEGRRILVVEDDVRNVFALTSVLEPKGAIIQITRNGREAIEAIEQSLASSEGKIDLVLMDVMMPEMDGITATREIRGRISAQHLPIIMLTAKAMKDDQEKCLAAGANDYIAKPLDVEKLLSLVRVWMPR